MSSLSIDYPLMSPYSQVKPTYTPTLNLVTPVVDTPFDLEPVSTTTSFITLETKKTISCAG